MLNVIWQANIDFCTGLGDTIEKGYDECCVCNEVTTLTTSCSHYVCIKCTSQLNNNKCPMCRGQIYDDDDDDMDDDDDEDNDDIYVSDEDEGGGGGGVVAEQAN